MLSAMSSSRSRSDGRPWPVEDALEVFSSHLVPSARRALAARLAGEEPHDPRQTSHRVSSVVHHDHRAEPNIEPAPPDGPRGHVEVLGDRTTGPARRRGWYLELATPRMPPP